MANLSNINDKFLVTTGGNILIGQTGAVGTSILQVTGNSTFSGELNVKNASTRFISLNYEDGINSIISHSGTSYGLESLNVRGDKIYFYTDYEASTPKGNITLTLENSHNAKFEGNVGIGISAGGNNLHIYKSNATALIQASNTSGIAQVQFFPRDASNVAHLQSIKGVDSSLTFLTGGNSGNSYVPTQRIRIDSGGSVIIGDGATSGTPAADYRSLEIGRQGNTITGAPWKSNLYFSTNATITAGSTAFTYRYASELPTKMIMEDGFWTFSNAVAGTVGSTISFTERMRIAADGYGYYYNRWYLASASNQGNLFFGTADDQYQLFGGGTYGYMGYNTGGYHRFLVNGSNRLQLEDGEMKVYSTAGLQVLRLTPDYVQTGVMPIKYPYYRIDSFKSDGSGYFWAFGHEKSDGTQSIGMMLNDGVSGNKYTRIINTLNIASFTSNEYNGAYPSFQTNVVLRNSGDSYFNGGNVGIGLTSPNTKLDVSGTTGTRNRNTQGSSVYETSLYFNAAGNATTNVSIDTTTAFPPIASGGFILVEVSASGYGNSGSNGLVFSYISGGYGGHYGGQGQPYHPVEIIANTMQAGSCNFYYPNSTTVGIAVTTTNSAGLSGLMRVKVTSTY